MTDLIDRAEVLKIIRNSYSTAFVTIKDYSDYLIKKIKKIQSPESTERLSLKTRQNINASKDTNTQRSGCGKRLKFESECGDITRMGVIQRCEKCQNQGCEEKLTFFLNEREKISFPCGEFDKLCEKC